MDVAVEESGSECGIVHHVEILDKSEEEGWLKK